MRKFRKDLKGYWYPVVESKILKTIQATSENIIDYYDKKYRNIFPEYRALDEVTFHEKTGYISLKRPEGSGGEALPYGVYTVGMDRIWDLTIKPLALNKKETFIPLDGVAETLQIDIVRFFANKEKYRELDIRHRRSCLMYGAQGNGKTTIINQVISGHQGYTFFLEDRYDNFADLTILRDALVGHPVVFIIEEITQMLVYAKESVLSLLDGEYSWAETYTLVTTNYPEELEKNMVDRPGRFNLLLHFDIPTTEQRNKYLSTFVTVDDNLLHKTDKFSIDDLRELVIRHKINDTPITDALEEMLKSKRIVKNSFKSSGSLGF